MKGQNRIVLILALALWPPVMSAQEPEAQAPDAQTQEAQTSEQQPVSAPPLLYGQPTPLTFQSEKVPSNRFFGGVGFTGTFTDNALLSSTNPVSDFTYLIQPYIGFSQATPRLEWGLNFAAGVEIDQRLTEDNQFAKSITLDFTYRLSPHLSLRLSNAFSDTTGLFAAVNPLQSGSGLAQQPNNSLLVPLVQRTLSNTTLAELSYHFSANNTIGIRGGAYILDYPDASSNVQSATLYDTQSYLVEGFYNHQISSSQWVGASLRTQRFDTASVITDASSLLLYYSVEPVKNLMVSFFGGPEYYSTPRLSDSPAFPGGVQTHQWTSAEGATVAWQRERTSLVATFSRQLSDGAGLTPAVTLQAASVSLRRELRRGLEAQFGITYGVDDPLSSDSVFPGYRFHSAYGRCELRQSVGDSLLLLLGYARQEQQWPGAQGSGVANISWFSVSYRFSHLFGTGTSTKPAGRLGL
jgi:hypothetical protein